MKIHNFCLLLCFVRLVFSIDTEDLFSNFIRTYKKNYVYGSGEYRLRFQIFKENLEKQEILNSKRNHSKSAWYGPTQFSDLTEKEFSEKYLSSYKSLYQPKIKDAEKFFEKYSGHDDDTIYFAPYVQLPSKIDWRDKKIVTSVKNQGSCGGCWAFSAVGVIESMYANKTGLLQSLSVQEVLDCSYAYKMLHGCKGGDTCTALSWLMMKNITLVPEKKYPTVDKPEQCKFSSIVKGPGAHVTNFTCFSYVNKENLLLQVLANVGPVSVSVDATNWNNYQGGIIQYHCGQASNNHAVDIVGYDLTGEIPYYIVKNSWGTGFGHNGYIYIMQGRNVCGLVQEVSTVEVDPR